MKLRIRILLISLAALAGLVFISGLALQALRQSLMEGKQEQILKVARLCSGVVDRYHEMEVAGTLGRPEAQARAIEALSGLHFKDDYIFVRTLDNHMLVHADQSRVGKIDKGSPTSDGRMTSDVFSQDLVRADHVFMIAMVPRPTSGDKVPLPKLLGAIRYEPWNWVIGNGVFIDDIDNAYRAYVIKFVGISGVLLIALSALGIQVSRQVQSRLGGEPEYAASATRRMASGDLSADLSVDGPDTSLLASMQLMQTSLRRIVQEVQKGAETIRTATREVAQGNQDLSNRTEQAAASLEETASSMENLTKNVRQGAEAALQASQLAKNASGIANQGGAIVTQVVTTMQGISESSRRIGDILGVIDGIAFQTNILALNAAVEAARAGEQGRGFAVVAAEVRTLAQRSAEAAKEIKGLIADSSVRVDAGVLLVQKAGATMEEIVLAVQQVSHVIDEVSQTTALQSSELSEMGASVNRMDQMTQQNAALVEQGAAAASSLQDQATRLTETVGTFRLN